MTLIYEVEGGNFLKAGYASSEVKKILKQLNIDARIIKRVVVALYEGEVNVVAHAMQGTVFVDIDDKRIYIKISDKGPGIPDIALAMQEGFSTASESVREMGFGAGMGLPNIKRNADWININSTVGEGTVLEMKTNF
jgi:anti-sigma regulatory factor (Ser/Thr protein kinase)